MRDSVCLISGETYERRAWPPTFVNKFGRKLSTNSNTSLTSNSYVAPFTLSSHRTRLHRLQLLLEKRMYNNLEFRNEVASSFILRNFLLIVMVPPNNPNPSHMFAQAALQRHLLKDFKGRSCYYYYFERPFSPLNLSHNIYTDS